MSTDQTMSTVITIVSGILSVVFGILLLTFKYAISQRDKEIDRRLDTGEKLSKENSEELKQAAERLRLEELKSVRLEGDLKRVEGELKSASQTHSSANASANDEIEDIRKAMITRQEFDRSVNSIENMLRQILSQLPQLRSTYASQGRFPVQETGSGTGDKDRR